MPITAPKPGPTIAPVPAGTHHAVCYGVVTLGTQPSQLYSPRPKVLIMWEIPGERIDIGDKKDLPRAISATYTLSLGDRATLRRVLETWRGRQFSPEELSTFEIDRLIGANALITVTHTEKGDRTFANVSSVTGILKGMTRLMLGTPELYFNISEALNTAMIDGKPMAFPENMPDWIQTKIKMSEEYIAFCGPDKLGHPASPPIEQPETVKDMQEDHEPTGEVPF